jgi:hypothetical protein
MVWFLMRYLTLIITLCLNATAGSCPATVYVSGNSAAASTIREVAVQEGRPFLKVVTNKKAAETILEVASGPGDDGTNVSGTLGNADGDMLWSKTTWQPRGSIYGEEVAARVLWHKLIDQKCHAEDQAWKATKKKGR